MNIILRWITNGQLSYRELKPFAAKIVDHLAIPGYTVDSLNRAIRLNSTIGQKLGSIACFLTVLSKLADRKVVEHLFGLHAVNDYLQSLEAGKQEFGLVCPECGSPLAPDEIVTYEFDNRKFHCHSCHADSLENGELTQCEECHKYFPGSDLLINQENGEREICPFCGKVWCE